jgi:glycosyltransferase involved in cell wall biosynthesis
LGRVFLKGLLFTIFAKVSDFPLINFMKKNINICFFIERFYPYQTGATNSAFRLAKELRNSEHNIFFITSRIDSKDEKHIEYDGFQVYRFPFSGSGKLRKAKAFAAIFFFLIKKRNKFQVFHMHGAHYGLLMVAWFVKKILKKPTIMKITLDGWDTPDGVIKNKYGKISLAMYKSLSAVVSMTSGQKKKCENWQILGKLLTIPNGYDNTKYYPVSDIQKIELRKKLGLINNVIYLIYVGWLGYRKGTDILIKSWKKVLHSHPETRLLCIGNYHGGKEGLEDFLKETSIQINYEEEKNIYVTDYVDNVEEYLQASDIFIFPSRSEGFGTVQVEAMACGLPGVVYNIDGVTSDIYDDGINGFIINNENPDNFAEKINILIRNKELREKMGAEAAKKARQKFTLKKIAAEYDLVYSHLINGKY